MEAIDRFEHCNEMLQFTPISHLKVSNFNYEHPPTTSFYNFYTPR